MAQSGYTPIQLYHSATASATPTAGNLADGELAINTNDGILYYKDSGGVVRTLASNNAASGTFTNLTYTGTLTGSTGVMNIGSGQLYKDASGNVGIGTTSPREKLDVSGNIAAPFLDNQTIQFQYLTGSGYGLGMMADATNRGLKLFTRSNDGTGYISFLTGGMSEKMRIDYSGDVGIAISSPVSNSLSITQYKNLSWVWSSGSNYANIFNQAGSASLILASGYKLSSTANGFASSFAGSWSKSAIEVGGGEAIKFFVDAATTVPVGTDITPTERMRIDSSGNVGIGTSSPSTKLDVAGVGRFVSQNSGATTSGAVTIRDYATDNSTGYVQWVDNANVNQLGAIGGIAGGGLKFQNGVNEAMRIDASGNLLVGTTSTLSPGGVSGVGNILNPNNNGVWALALQNNATTAGLGRGLGIRNATDFNTTSSEFIYCVGNATPRFYVQSNGGIYNYSANNTNLSDARVKKDIEPVGSWLDKINAIEVVNFKYKDQTFDEPNIGVIAQQVLSVAPELINEDGFGDTPEDGKPLLSVFETDLMYAMLKAIQELKAELDELKSQLGK